MGFKQKALEKVLGSIGLGPDSTLLDVVEVANDYLDLGLVVKDLPCTPDATLGAMSELGKSAAAVVASRRGKLFSLDARPEGKARMRAVVVIGE